MSARLKFHLLVREALYEDNELPQNTRHLAALLASKVYYFLAEYDEALSFALGAGSAFQKEFKVPASEEYVETIICASHYLLLLGFSVADCVQPEPLTVI
jgi:26S proteasome regulatory subunit N2